MHLGTRRDVLSSDCLPDAQRIFHCAYPKDDTSHSRRWILLLTVASLAACTGSNMLSDSMAKRALEKWMGQDGTITGVLGVQERPEQNDAKVDFEVKDFRYSLQFTFGPKTARIYSGKGTADFIRYNDGSWVLKSISVNDAGPNKFIDGPTKWIVKERIDTK